jgi:hypothetical protein
MFQMPLSPLAHEDPIKNLRTPHMNKAWIIHCIFQVNEQRPLIYNHSGIPTDLSGITKQWIAENPKYTDTVPTKVCKRVTMIVLQKIQFVSQATHNDTEYMTWFVRLLPTCEHCLHESLQYTEFTGKMLKCSYSFFNHMKCVKS